MVDLYRSRVEWTGLKGLPGVSTFYVNASADKVVWLADLESFFDNVKALHPTGLHWSIPDGGEIIDSTTGQATGNWNTGVGSPAVVDATGSLPYAAPSGWVATWQTQFYAGGRRVKGRTFMVPLSSEFYDSDGSIGAEALVVMRDAADSLAANSNMTLYLPTSNGDATVSSATVTDSAAVLRSRRD